MTAIANENPITKTLRASSRRVVIICNPLVNTKADVKNNDAPITGTGIAAKPIEAIGTIEKITKAMPVAKPTLRLVMPMALDNPTEELLLLRPELPINPESKVAKPLAATPPVGAPPAGERAEVGAYPVLVVETLSVRDVAHGSQGCRKSRDRERRQ